MNGRKRIFIVLILLITSACTGISPSAGAPSTATALPQFSGATAAPTLPQTATAETQAAPTSPTAAAATPTVTPPVPLTADEILAEISGATPTPQALPTQQHTENQQPATATPATPQPTQTQGPQSLFDQYIPGYQKIGETEHFVYYAQNNYVPVDFEQWKQESEQIYQYVSQRVNATGQQKIEVAFHQPQQEACPICGLASPSDPPQVLIFADQNSSIDYLHAVLAHELGHAIPAEGYKGGLPNDISLTEGLATYAAGKYWDAWQNQPSMDALIRSYIQAGKYVPLPQITDLPQVYPWQPGSSENCLERRDQLYSEWGDFIGFLVDRYGWDPVHQLFKSARTERQGGLVTEYPSDYQKVFGLTLNQLEVAWLKSVMRLQTAQLR